MVEPHVRGMLSFAVEWAKMHWGVLVNRGLFTALLLWTLPSQLAYGSDAQNIASLKPAIVYIEVTYTEPTGHVTTESGTGFIISSAGYAITANHLINSTGAHATAVIGSRYGDKLPAMLIPSLSPGDATLIALPSSHAPYPTVKLIDPLALAQGQPLIALGFPLTSDLSVASGVLSAKGGPDAMWQVSIPLNYGNSGGPVIDASGRVVGMVKGGIANAQGINFMIPNNFLAPLFIMAGLVWPPYPIQNPQNAVTFSQPVLTTPLPSQGGQTNCHEVVVESPGIPPNYQRSVICDR